MFKRETWSCCTLVEICSYVMMATTFLHFLCVMVFLTVMVNFLMMNTTANAIIITKHANFPPEMNNPKDCTPLYQLKHGKCQPHHSKSDIGQISPINTPAFFQCQNGHKIDHILVDDLHVDCLPLGDDEPLLLLVQKGVKFVHCQSKDQIPCRFGYPRCFYITDVCKYILQRNKYLFPCRTGEHLQDCTNFQCSTMFKCPAYFCIPMNYVCDGKWDCPNGTDQLVNTLCSIKRRGRTYKHLFKCRYSHTCLHFTDVCNGKTDCPFADDESLCLLKSVVCPENCNCLTFAVMCNELEGLSDHGFKYYRTIHLSHLPKGCFDKSELL